jgi:hypothetical protein
MKKITNNYWLLLGIQSVGAAVIIAAALPLYRIILFHMDEYKNDGFYAMWGLVGVLLTSRRSSIKSFNTWICGKTPMPHRIEVPRRKRLLLTPPTAS